MKIEERITKAKCQLLIHEPWFGQLACYLTMHATNDLPIETPACVTLAGDMYYRSDWMDKLSDLEIKGIICHEIMHLAYSHLTRIQQRDANLFNIAADLKINLDIKKSGYMNLPDGLLIPVYDDWSYELPDGKMVTINDIDIKTTEQIYEELNQQLPPKQIFMLDLIIGSGMGDKKGKGKVGKDLLEKINKRFSKSEIDNLAREWQGRVNTANQLSKGSTPKGLLREMAALENPELSWLQIIQTRFSKNEKSKSWRYPNKRWLPMFFPANIKTKGLKSVIAIDTSGSMSETELSQALSEIWGLSQQFKTFQIFVVTCDAKIYDIFEVKNGNKNKLFDIIKLRGGGGTSSIPVFEMIKEKFRDTIDCLIFFTDLETDFPNKTPLYPVYWVSQYHEAKVPFGKIVKLRRTK
jgi:predicted metal-dependent peptidase